MLDRDFFDSLAEGYQLILGRLGRAMKQADLYRIECVGKLVRSQPHDGRRGRQRPASGRRAWWSTRCGRAIIGKARFSRFAEVRAVRSVSCRLSLEP